jgi:glycosyltransferase involved in cell wall biosynthesis
MSTYRNETASNLAAALESIYVQSEPPAEIVLVVDGPVPGDQDDVIATYESDERIGHLKVLRLAQGRGMALALNAGLECCTGTFIARMDSDDICFPERFAEQWRVIREQPKIDIVGSWSAEFREDPMLVTGLKTPPENHRDIIRALTWRNVLVHPSILVRKEAAERIGGWRPTFGDYADYEFYVRLALIGAVFHMIQRPLVRYRTSLAQRQRRSGRQYAIDELNFRLFCYHNAFISLPKFLLITPIYCLFRLTPPALKEHLYQLVRARPMPS